MTNSSVPQSGSEPESPASLVEGWNSLSPDGAEHEAEALRRNTPLPTLLAKLLGQDERHLSLADLQILIQRHRQASNAWEMPSHLATCPVCLGLFEALQDKGAGPGDEAVRRYRDLWPKLFASKLIPRHAFPWRNHLTALAAGLAIIATGIYIFGSGMGRVPGRVTEGSGSLSAGSHVALLADAAVPSRQDVVTETGMKLVLGDGSTISLAPHSRFRLSTSWIGQTTLTLARGEANLAVIKQSLGRTLAVETPVGKITVIGTRFRVKTIEVSALVHEQTAGNSSTIKSYFEKIESVVVTVSEGVVKASNTHGAVLVRAGYSAVLHGNQPMIELKPSISEPLP